MKRAISLGAAVLAAGVSTVASAQVQPHGPMIIGTRLDVSARGEVMRTPDIALINAGVVTQAANAATAMAENATRMARMVAALRKAGIAERDLSTASISLSPQYRYVENQAPVITGYQASNQLNVRFRDIAKSGSVLDTLVKEGANQINGPTMTLDNSQAAMDEARIAAVKNARARADLYAAATGMTVKRIVSISESEGYTPGPMPIMQRSAAMDASAKTEMLPGEQSIAVSVNVVFELN
jgi:uncharacterized protein